ncbi:hypothetical protein EGU77_30040 [Pseudomonas syringae pv. theae]|nr:hypothetical protein [Pseudomonas syringae pv. theae]
MGSPGNAGAGMEPSAHETCHVRYSFRKTGRLLVTTCNRNGPDLQSSRFSTGIDCVYPLSTNSHRQRLRGRPRKFGI